ncbi:hypothetical protein [Alteromonas sp. P256]|uniref:hypothetical protein n=1 Tax=Alteromonas sp. P256 TaxID=3117399 RepID=UPI002FE2EBE9
MNTLLKKLSTPNGHRDSFTTDQTVQMRCNYADNYYGDRVCVEVKNTQSRINIHVGVQL